MRTFVTPLYGDPDGVLFKYDVAIVTLTPETAQRLLRLMDKVNELRQEDPQVIRIELFDEGSVIPYGITEAAEEKASTDPLCEALLAAHDGEVRDITEHATLWEKGLLAVGGTDYVICMVGEDNVIWRVCARHSDIVKETDYFSRELIESVLATAEV